MNYKRGIQLSPQQRAQVLAACSDRYTGDHTPGWVYDSAINKGIFYPVQFRDDLDWLVHTRFPVGANGRVSPNFSHGEQLGIPTYPFGNEVTRLD